MTTPRRPGGTDPAQFPAVDGELVAALERAGQDLVSREVPPDVADTHLQAIRALAASHAHVAPVAAVTPQRTWGPRVRRVLGLTAIKIGLAAGVAVAATGGAAATGNLPDPVQRVVSDGASLLGITLPHPDAPTLPDQANDRARERANLPTPPRPADRVPDHVPGPPTAPPGRPDDPREPPPQKPPADRGDPVRPDPAQDRGRGPAQGPAGDDADDVDTQQAPATDEDTDSMSDSSPPTSGSGQGPGGPTHTPSPQRGGTGS